MREDKIFVAKLGVRLEKAIGAKLTSYTLSYKDVSVDIFTWQVSLVLFVSSNVGLTVKDSKDYA